MWVIFRQNCVNFKHFSIIQYTPTNVSGTWRKDVDIEFDFLVRRNKQIGKHVEKKKEKKKRMLENK